MKEVEHGTGTSHIYYPEEGFYNLVDFDHTQAGQNHFNEINVLATQASDEIQENKGISPVLNYQNSNLTNKFTNTTFVNAPFYKKPYALLHYNGIDYIGKLSENKRTDPNNPSLVIKHDGTNYFLDNQKDIYVCNGTHYNSSWLGSWFPFHTAPLNYIIANGVNISKEEYDSGAKERTTLKLGPYFYIPHKGISTSTGINEEIDDMIYDGYINGTKVGNFCYSLTRIGNWLIRNFNTLVKGNFKDYSSTYYIQNTRVIYLEYNEYTDEFITEMHEYLMKTGTPEDNYNITLNLASPQRILNTVGSTKLNVLSYSQGSAKKNWDKDTGPAYIYKLIDGNWEPVVRIAVLVCPNYQTSTSITFFDEYYPITDDLNLTEED